MRSPGVSNKIQEMFGDPKVSAGFISSVISVANGNSLLRNADPMTVIGAAMVAATMQLPIIPTLGLAYIVPYKGKAQFQIGYKGLIELAERSGQFANIIDEVVYEGQLVEANKFEGKYVFNEAAKKSDKVIGYMARFDLVNGFSKTIYWTLEEVQKHANKFSQSYRTGKSSPWQTDFDSMARKTVLKRLFDKYAPKSIQIQQAIQYDQATVRANDSVVDAQAEEIVIEAFEAEYSDNPQEPVSTEETASAAKQKAMEAKERAQAAAARQARTTVTPAAKAPKAEAEVAPTDESASEAAEVPENVDPETGEVINTSEK